MTYLVEITKNCDCDESLPLTLSGNAFSPGTFKVTCKCGTDGNVCSAQEVGLDPTSPGFQGRVEEILADSPVLKYYLVTVTDGKMTMEPRLRTQVRVEFHAVAECKTCSKTIGDPKCSQKELNDFVAEHKGHNGFSTSTVLDTNDPRITKMVEQAIKNQQKSH